MAHWDTLRTISTARFTVALQVDYETDQDLSWADEETLDKINRGVWGNYVFRVVVYFDGMEVGADYLGNSVYENPADFAREHIGIRPKGRADGCNYGSYFSDMVAIAIGEARKHLCSVPKLRCA